MFKQKNYLALGAVVFVAVLLLSLPTRATVRLKLAVGSWFLPLFGLAGAAQQLPADLADSVLPRRELLHQIDELRRANQQLREQQIQTDAIRRENDQLRTSLGWQRQVPWRLKLANVVMRDPVNWWRTVQIDLGSRDGITTNQPVLTEAGLVGRVSSVGLVSSQVMLIGDPNCRISAAVDNSTHDMGVLTAGGPLDTSLVQLSYLASGANLKAGQDVLTSGLGGVFPKGIPIGKVVEAHPIEENLATEASVRLNANLGALERVWVYSDDLFSTHLDSELRAAGGVLRGDAGGATPLAGAQVDVLPALMVYAALNADVVTVSLLAVLGGMWLDSLSANPLGASIVPLFAVGFPIYLRRDLILRDLPFAQVVLGTTASALAPVLTVLLLLNAGRQPIIGWGSLWQWVVMTVGGAAATPVIFALFDWCGRTLGYKEEAAMAFASTAKSGTEKF